jgi:prepilin-type processing-associated H-X9-DG protein
MVYAMRHGTRKAGAPLSDYRFNAIFFDGHVETLNGQAGMNPQLWLPKGAILPATELTDEAKKLYMSSAKTLLIQ